MTTMYSSQAGRSNERGAALLMVLLLTVLLSGLIVTAMDELRFAVRRTINLRSQDQAQWYALGAEDLARQVIWRGWKTSPDRTLLSDAWSADGITFATEGGSIAGRILDGGNCYNLNSIDYRSSSEGDDGLAVGQIEFENLAQAVGIGRDVAQSLGAALGDWIDADSTPRSRGAEDSAYMGLTPPYRTAGGPLADPSELRAIRGFTANVYRRLRPFVCAMASPDPSQINVNTLAVEQAPLLVMLVGDDLSHAAAERVIQQRPLSGYTSTDAFWAREELIVFNVKQEMKAQVGLATRHFILRTEVFNQDTELVTTALLELDEAGKFTVRGRRLGELE